MNEKPGERLYVVPREYVELYKEFIGLLPPLSAWPQERYLSHIEKDDEFGQALFKKRMDLVKRELIKHGTENPSDELVYKASLSFLRVTIEEFKKSKG